MARQLTRLRRQPGWERRLADFLAESEARPFDWRTGNCCLFAADAVAAMTGEDPALPFRLADIADAAAAAAAMQAYCGGGVRETLEAICAAAGFRQAAPSFAGRGDVVHSTRAGGMAGLVCMDARNAAFLLPERGFVRLPVLAWCDAAWLVP